MSRRFKLGAHAVPDTRVIMQGPILSNDASLVNLFLDNFDRPSSSIVKEIGDAGAGEIAKALALNTTLTQLELASNSLGG